MCFVLRIDFFGDSVPQKRQETAYARTAHMITHVNSVPQKSQETACARTAHMITYEDSVPQKRQETACAHTAHMITYVDSVPQKQQETAYSVLQMQFSFWGIWRAVYRYAGKYVG